MNSIKKLTAYFLTAIGLMAVTMAVGLGTAPKLMAAIKAALVQNVDEPGRNPYMGVVSFSCPGSACAGTLPPVAAGTRLVITNYHVRCNLTLPVTFVEGLLFGTTASGHNLQLTFPMTTLAPGAQVGQETAYAANQPVIVYYSAGETPTISINSDRPVSGYGVLSGYIVNLN